VHAYFKEGFLGGILRLMSGLEIQNSMFSPLTCPNLSVVDYLVLFVHVIDSRCIMREKLKMHL